jgi:hypothetical protein
MALDLDVQILSEKLLESTFICMKPQAHIMSESAIIIILVQRSFPTYGAATPYFGPLGHVESNLNVSYGWSTTQLPYGRPPIPIKPSRRH